MQDRFNFNAIVTGYYYIDTPEKCQEFEPQFYLENVDVFSDEIGIDYDRLLNTIREQCKNVSEIEIQKIMGFFQDNSNAYDGDVYVTIKPDKILQCTGLKDKNGKLIYESDILKDKYGALHPISWNVKGFYEADTFAIAGFYKTIQEDMEVIGNIYENKELINE